MNSNKVKQFFTLLFSHFFSHFFSHLRNDLNACLILLHAHVGLLFGVPIAKPLVGYRIKKCAKPMPSVYISKYKFLLGIIYGVYYIPKFVGSLINYSAHLNLPDSGNSIVLQMSGVEGTNYNFLHDEITDSLESGVYYSATLSLQCYEASENTFKRVWKHFTFSLDDRDCISELVSFIRESIEEAGHIPESTDIILLFYTGVPGDMMPREFLVKSHNKYHLSCNRSFSRVRDNTGIVINRTCNLWHTSFLVSCRKVRGFSTTTFKCIAHQSVVNIITQADINNSYNNAKGNIIPNAESQRFLERLSLDQYELNKDNIRLIAHVDSSVLGGQVSKYVMDRSDQLMVYIDKLRINVNDYIGSDPYKVLMKDVFNVVGDDFFKSTCLYTFLLVARHHIYGNSSVS